MSNTKTEACPVFGVECRELAERDELRDQLAQMKTRLDEAREALKTALRQWDSYAADNRFGCDLKTDESAEGEIYRDCAKKLAEGK